MAAMDSDDTSREVAESELLNLLSNTIQQLQNAHDLDSITSGSKVLEFIITRRLQDLPAGVREGLKNWFFELLKGISDSNVQQRRLFLNQIRTCLVQLFRLEWPYKWLDFIPDLVKVARTNHLSCGGCMDILKLLNDEVLSDSNWGSDTSSLKERWQREYNQYCGPLFIEILSEWEETAEHIKATLSTLEAFISWIAPDCIFNTPLLRLVLQLLPRAPFRNLTLQCLTKVAARRFDDSIALYRERCIEMYCRVIDQLHTVLPPTVTDIHHIYAYGNSELQAFYQNLTLFFPSFYECHLHFLETEESVPRLRMGLEFLIAISCIESFQHLKVVACDNFLKISMDCKRKFVVEQGPFISKLLLECCSCARHLQLHTFYEFVSNMILVESRHQGKVEFLLRLMDFTTLHWTGIVNQISCNFLEQPDTMQMLLQILQIITYVAAWWGETFFSQFEFNHSEMLDVFRMYNKLISKNPDASKTSHVELMRSVKRETLKLIETFLSKDKRLTWEIFSPCMYGKYSLPEFIESEILSLSTTAIIRYKDSIITDIPNIFEDILQFTHEMIVNTVDDYTEHHKKFFALLHATTTHCFSGLTRLSREQWNLVLESLIWAFQHNEISVVESGLGVLLEMLKKIQDSGFCNQFHRMHFFQIVREILDVITGPDHRPAVQLHVLVLHHLFRLVLSDQLIEPLSDDIPEGTTNASYFKLSTSRRLQKKIPMMEDTEGDDWVNLLCQSVDDISLFQTRLSEFVGFCSGRR